jgi:hypothetical protein
MSWRIVVAIIALLVLPSCRTSSLTTYYLTPQHVDWYVAVSGSDSNGGRSPDEAFATIARAAFLAQPGDTVLVGKGTYKGTISTTVSGTEDRRIVFVSEVPLGAKIDGSGNFAAWDNRGNYVDIVGFEVTGSNYQGIISYGSNVHILNNWVHHLAVPTCNTPNGGAGINHANYAASNNWTAGNIVNNVLAPTGCSGLVHGIYHANTGGRVQNNIVFSVTAGGIHTWHAANGVTITNNLVWDANIGIIVGADGLQADGYIVTNNILLDTVLGIQEVGRRFGSNSYLNNLFYSNRRDYQMVNGIPKASITSAPSFVNFDESGTGDYRLRPDSPAVNAGTREGAPAFDFAGTLRPQQGAVDIGPFEYCGGTCATGPGE